MNPNRWLIAILVLVFGVFFGHHALAEQVTFNIAPIPEVKFDAEKADKSVVKITGLNGKFRGTGFYVGNDTIVTANHITTRMIRTPFGNVKHPEGDIEHLLAWNQLGRVALLTVTHRDEVNDVATLTIANNKLALVPVKFAKKKPKRGEVIYMVGHPMGFEWSLSQGYLSHDGKKMPDGEMRSLVFLLATGGSSGSPVFNKRGEVVGLTSQIFTQGAGVLYVPVSVFKHYKK